MSDRTKFRVHPERSAPDEIGAILSAGIVAHVGAVDERGPVVIPMIYHYDPAEPARLYLRGAAHGRLLEAAMAGASMCATVTLVEGFVYSRTVLYHSVNYRSALCFGRGAPATDAECEHVLSAMIPRYFPDRIAGRDFDPMPNAHINATRVIVVTIEEATAKSVAAAPKARAMTMRVPAAAQASSSCGASSSRLTR